MDCEDILQNPILCAILASIRNSKTLAIAKENDKELCGKDYFSFTIKFKGHGLVTTVSEGDEHLTYLALVRPVNDTTTTGFKDFKGLIINPDLLFHAGEITQKLTNGSEQTLAVARYDDVKSNYTLDNIEGRFLDTLLNLRRFFDQIPPDFLAE